MIKVLFVCHGNICRSPMAEFIFKDMIKKRHLENEFYCESCATSTEEIGNDMYPPAKRKLREKNIEFTKRKARQITREDIDKFDYIFIMDQYNIRYLSFLGLLGSPKIMRLLIYSDHPRDISDPWYTGDFEATYQDIVEGEEAFLKHLGY